LAVFFLFDIIRKMPMRNRKIVSGFLIALLISNILAWLAVYDLSGPGFLEVTFLMSARAMLYLLRHLKGSKF